MTPKLFKTTLATYIRASWEGKNESGWDPIGDKVLIKPDTVAETTKGGIQLPQDVADRMTMAAEGGIIIAVGDGAFKWNADGTPFIGKVPKAGSRISMGRYSGQLVMGHDGGTYRILESKELGAMEHKS